jgi:hypothetical protein
VANGRYRRKPDSAKKSATPYARSGTQLAKMPRSTAEPLGDESAHEW